MKPTIKSLLRRVEVWKKRYKLVVDSRQAQAKEIETYRNQVRDLLERKVRELRLANEGLQAATSTLAANNVELQELKDQVAVQQKQNAESQSDTGRAIELANQATARYNRVLEQMQGQGVSIARMVARQDSVYGWLRARGLRGPRQS